IVLRRCESGQASKIGTSGQVLTCQRALVNTDHAESDGTNSRVTSTITARGSSSAALMTASRSDRYVALSSTPSAVRISTSSRCPTSISSGVLKSAIGPTEIAGRGSRSRQPITQHRQCTFGFLGQRRVAVEEGPMTHAASELSGQFGLLLQAAQRDP